MAEASKRRPNATRITNQEPRFYNFSSPVFHQTELSPGILHGRLKIYHNKLKNNELHNCRTMASSKKFPIDPGTVHNLNTLTTYRILEPMSASGDEISFH